MDQVKQNGKFVKVECQNEDSSIICLTKWLGIFCRQKVEFNILMKLSEIHKLY